jgi:hypothetical protein
MRCFTGCYQDILYVWPIGLDEVRDVLEAGLGAATPHSAITPQIIASVVFFAFALLFVIPAGNLPLFPIERSSIRREQGPSGP